MIGAGIGLAFYQACYFLAVVWVGVAVATMVSLGVAPVVITVWGPSVGGGDLRLVGWGR